MPLSDARLLGVPPLHIHSVGRFNPLAEMVGLAAGATFQSAAWLTNNRAIYAPINIPFRFTVARFMVANGTNATGNVDVGLYYATGNLFISTGTIARAGTSVMQYIDVTNQSFPPGHYYLALVASSTTGTFMRSQTGTGIPARYQASGWLQEDLGSTVLPATMNPAPFSSVGFCWGFTQSDTL